ncbi:MAG: flavin reductase family protein [Nitrososphaerota archaeon]|nr:flavin reductase family protein [Nitrososphaerota archaeon]MDG6964407.1 flavin reductase family protein [Nitrososphaerota archaeon]MDG6974811.1 flavin reductase family protein [Nitrososphaerota archaeon]MDG7010337.1 flavin reductase family protein [Nitrososphaerota archaeon]MDG7019207.1 flavin reductase family protein [Nitrososphaerota archaeon]
MKVDPSLIHRLFYPQVPLVMAARHGGRVSAMPVVSYLVASENPPMVGVACAPKGFTCRLALKAGSFSLSVLDRSRRDAVSRLATTSGAEVEDKLSEVGLKYEAGKRVNAPVLRDALATLECTLKSSKRAGDHLLLLGSVESASASDAFTDRWDYARYRPILYTGWTEGLTLFPGS